MQDTVFAAYIEAVPGITPQQVADHLGVSVRTVRTYVNRANDVMKQFARIDLNRGMGYRLVVTDEQRYRAWVGGDADQNGDMPQTPQQRVNYLLNDLLMRTDWITLGDLSKILFVSRSMISTDLKDVEKRLQTFGLELEKRPHYGIRVEGPEMARRLCLANVIMDTLDHASSVPASIEALFDGSVRESTETSEKHGNLLATISNSVQRITSEEDFQINSMAYQNLLVHIAIAIKRIKEGCYVPMKSDDLESLKASHEYEIAQRIAAVLQEATGTKLPEEEIGYMAIHLAGKQTIDTAPDSSEGLVVSPEIWDIVSEMLERVWQAFRFDFRNDLELRMNLARHIAPLAVRLRYHMNLKNPLLDDIKARYPLDYSMASDASAVLSEHYDARVSEDEIGYIALAFALAMERQKTAAPKKTILMVCASGAGSARLLEYRCRQEFGAYIDKIITCDIMSLPKMDFTDIDYVFTTVPISQKLPVPVREVQYFLDPDDVEDVKELLREGAPLAGSDMLSHFDKELFFPHLTLATKTEVLDFMLDEVVARLPVPQNFRELVWKREGTVATSFGNNVAMPHPFEAVTDRTLIVVALLDEPVAWDSAGHMVQAVFLSLFSREEDSETQRFFSLLADMLVSHEAIETLVGDQRWETLEHLLTSTSQGIPTEARHVSVVA